MSDEIDMAQYTPGKMEERVEDIRVHIREDLLPEAQKHPEANFILRFVQYLDRQAQLFEASLVGPIEHLTLATRNLLEFRSLLSQIFTNQKTRDQFIGEAHLDAAEVRARAERMGIPGHLIIDDVPEWHEIPDKHLLVMRDKYDEYIFKVCSKRIHPTALSILADDCIPSRFMYYFFGLNYLGQSYNFLSERVFGELDAS
jgi:hypothetical protein